MNLLERAKSIAHGASILTSWLGSGAEVVDYPTAQSRAIVCLACPKREPCPKFEANAAAAVQKIIEVKNALKLTINGEIAVGCCSACGCVNSLKVWMPIPRILSETTDDERARFDPKCWILTEKP